MDVPPWLWRGVSSSFEPQRHPPRHLPGGRLRALPPMQLRSMAATRQGGHVVAAGRVGVVAAEAVGEAVVAAEAVEEAVAVAAAAVRAEVRVR